MKSLIDILLDRIFDADWKGRHGENLIEWELKLVSLFGCNGKALRNIYIPKDNGETTEIDLVFITAKGIYVIESKNYSGWIFGDEKSMYWTAMLPNGEKNQFYNPIKQNKTHIKWLSQYLKNEIPMFSMIVFSERCELKKVLVDNSNIKVIKRGRLNAEVRNIWNMSDSKLGEDQIRDIYEKLQVLTKVDQAVKIAHIDTIKAKNKRLDGILENSRMEVTCPWCGGALVMRSAKKGINIGKSFYGCSNFPKCKYTCDIN